MKDRELALSEMLHLKSEINEKKKSKLKKHQSTLSNRSLVKKGIHLFT